MGSVGFIGLGNMGSHMARSLLRAGRRVVVNDVCQTAMRKLEEEGATAAASPSALAAAVGAGTLITMLPSCAAVREVYTEALAAPGFAAELCIDCSTVEPGTATTVASWAAAQAGAAFVDAPVSGGVGGAEQATLTFMVGAEEEATVRRAEPLLLQMGRSVVHCGEVGSGQAVKLCNNLVLATTMLAVSEGMLLGSKLGVDPKTLAQVFNASTARSWSSEVYNPCPGVMEGVPASRDYEGGFSHDLMLKDLSLALRAAAQAGAPAPSGEHAMRLYSMSAASGLAGKDFGGRLCTPRHSPRLTRVLYLPHLTVLDVTSSPSRGLVTCQASTNPDPNPNPSQASTSSSPSELRLRVTGSGGTARRKHCAASSARATRRATAGLELGRGRSRGPTA